LNQSIFIERRSILRYTIFAKLAICSLLAFSLTGAYADFVLAATPETAPSKQPPIAGTSPASAKGFQLQPNQSSVAVKKTIPTPSQPPTSQIKAAEQRAFDLLNADRRANGLPRLKLNGSLVVLAENYGQDMIKRNYFSHYNPEGQSPFDRMRNSGINYRYAGENLAIHKNVDAAEKALMNSPGHRANILSPNYTEVGVGVSYDSHGLVYIVQEFIGR
jgi:uncharacterized protein YkwD